jgi:hypothetical protein
MKTDLLLPTDDSPPICNTGKEEKLRSGASCTGKANHENGAPESAGKVGLAKRNYSPPGGKDKLRRAMRLSF